MNQLIAPIGAAILIIGTIFLVGMPSSRRMAPWMGQHMGANSDTDLIAARAAWQRMGLLSGGVLVVLAVALFVSDLDPYLAPVGYAVAIIAGSAVSVGGGLRRRAELGSAGRGTITLTVPLRISLVLSVGIILAATFAALELSAQTEHWSGMLSLTSTLWPFGIDFRQMTVIASASLFISALVCACQWILLRRQSIAGASAAVDSMVRILASKRIALAALGGQLMLAGALLPAIQIFTLHVVGYDYIVSSSADFVGSLLGCVAFATGMIVCLYAVLYPLWVGPKTSPRARKLENSPVDSEDIRDGGVDAWNSK